MKTKKVQTAFRFDPILIGRLKEAAKMADVSLNEYVTIVLTDATKDIESEAEKEENRRKTEEFLKACAGSWVGDESVETIMHYIKDGQISKEVIVL